jgi:hypothetical protein
MNAILEFLYNTESMWSTYGGVSPTIGKDNDGAYYFMDQTKYKNNKYMADLTTFACEPGVLGAMATDAAANDPFFWALHLLYDKVWSLKRMKGELDISDWIDVENQCFGANPSDEMPFSFTGGSYMTNMELYEYFDPTNQYLPYIYDSL